MTTTTPAECAETSSGKKSDQGIVLDVRNLEMHFTTKKGVGRALNGVSFQIKKGETLGLVGESGCGKSMTALSIIGLNPKPSSEVVGGEVIFNGENLAGKSSEEMRFFRGAHISIALQDPMTALNPVFTVGDQLSESLRLHTKLRGAGLKERAVSLMRMLRIPDPEERLGAYPHQFSGGMRQRAVGAIALSGEPELLIADEPTTALDVTVQAAYLALLAEIQEETGLSILFITHDFGVVARICDRVGVMYAGRIVEMASTNELLDAPSHPYTQALVRSVPDLQSPVERLPSIEGQHPSIYEPEPGCPFAPRCAHVEDRCRREQPPEVAVGLGHTVSCFRYVS